MNFRNLLNEHKLETEEDLSEKAEFVLKNRMYNTRMDRQDEHPKYDVFDWNEMNERI